MLKLSDGACQLERLVGLVDTWVVIANRHASGALFVLVSYVTRKGS